VFNIVLDKGLADRLGGVLEAVAAQASGILDAIGVQAAAPYGQGYLNPDSIPSAREVERASEIIRRARVETGLPLLDQVSDYFNVKPNTWGSYGAIVNPAGYVYPLIEGADTLSDIARELSFDNVREKSLAEIWRSSPTLTKYRGTAWLPEVCQGCEVRDQCRGGSRLNAFVLTNDMSQTDPFCVLAPGHDRVLARYAG
jgi:pyrroloquinoline quinone biosynthesis protein E